MTSPYAGKLEVKSDWGGGRLMIAGTDFIVASPEQLRPVVNIFKGGVRVGEGLISGERREHGSDSDHGHNQYWSAFDLNITLPPTGAGINVRELERQGFEVHVITA